MNRIENQGKAGREPVGLRQYPLQSPEDGPQLPRKERETLRHRRELLEATEKLLVSKRFHEITIHDIAMESEFSVGYIYKLFPNKDEIVAALVHQKLGELRLLLDASLNASGTWEERALNMLLAMLPWIEETPAYRSGVIPDLKLFARVHPGVSSDLVEFREFLKGRVDGVFREALRQNRLVEDEAGMISRTFIALVSGFTSDSLLEHPPGERLSAHAPLIVNIIKQAFAPKGGDR
jgi:AcrR family transcriptional regulator